MRKYEKFITTFNDMLSTDSGNIVQRGIKKYIQVEDPDGIIALLEFLQVDKFQKLAIRIFGSESKKSKLQTNYNLANGSIENLLDFATNKTTYNELGHLIQIPPTIFFILFATYLTDHRIDPFISMLFSFPLMHCYCVLSQRYTRARLSRVINACLTSGKRINSNMYNNHLSIELPNSSYYAPKRIKK